MRADCQLIVSYLSIITELTEYASFAHIHGETPLGRWYVYVCGVVESQRADATGPNSGGGIGDRESRKEIEKGGGLRVTSQTHEVKDAMQKRGRQEREGEH